MTTVKSCPIPSDALLKRYHKSDHIADCYSAVVPGLYSQEQFVVAFYSTRLFKLERFILKWVVSRPSTDEQLALLASGEASEFAAWSVEDKSQNQILLCDFKEDTRSWLMATPIDTEVGNSTRLYFGSAVVPALNKKTGERRVPWPFKAFLGFHERYSVALLSAAAKRLISNA